MTASDPVSVGGEGSNSASDSTGVLQIAGGNTSSGSTGVVQTGPVTGGPSVTSGGRPGVDGTTFAAANAPAAGPGTTVPADGGVNAPGERTTAAVPSDEPVGRLGGNITETPIVGQLPFTGLGLLLLVLLGLALCATGLGIRKITPRVGQESPFWG